MKLLLLVFLLPSFFIATLASAGHDLKHWGVRGCLQRIDFALEDLSEGFVSAHFESHHRIDRDLEPDEIEYLKKWRAKPELKSAKPTKNTYFQLASESGTEKLRAIRINMTAEAARSVDTSEITNTLFEELGHVLQSLPEVELWVTFESAARVKFQTALANLPENVRQRVKGTELKPDAKITDWAQDSSKPMSKRKGTLLRRGTDFESDSYNMVAVRTTGIDRGNIVRRSRVEFEGGNIVVGDHHVLVGPKVVQDTMRDFKFTRSAALKKIAEEFGKPVIEIGYPDLKGKVQQAQYHIDLSVALVQDHHHPGHEVALVNSPYALFEQVLHMPSLEGMDEKIFKNQLKAALDSLRTQITQGKRKPFNSFETDFIRTLTTAPFKHIQSEEYKHRAIERILEANGYETRSVPGHTTILGYIDRNVTTYNATNTILSGSDAIVPDYQTPLLDQVVWGIYRNLGYRIHPLKAVRGLMCMRGGIRCATETYRKAEPYED